MKLAAKKKTAAKLGQPLAITSRLCVQCEATFVGTASILFSSTVGYSNSRKNHCELILEQGFVGQWYKWSLASG